MKPFNVGDKVWSFQHGESVVDEIDMKSLHPVIVSKDEYRQDGKWQGNNKYPTLYHLEDAKRLFPYFFQEGAVVTNVNGHTGLEKKKKLLAPAMVGYKGELHLTYHLYSSEEHANSNNERDYLVVIWPAIPNADGFYEVDE